MTNNELIDIAALLTILNGVASMYEDGDRAASRAMELAEYAYKEAVAAGHLCDEADFLFKVQRFCFNKLKEEYLDDQKE